MKIVVRPFVRLTKTVFCCVCIVMIISCASISVPENGMILKHVSVVNEQAETQLPDLTAYVRQHPATKVFSVIPNKSGRVLYDSLAAAMTVNDLRMTLQNMGYMHAQVELENRIKKNKVSSIYHLFPGDDYYVSSIESIVEDDSIRSILSNNKSLLSPLSPGERFSVDKLNEVRKSITSYLQNRGYYHFNKDYIEFDVDTILNQKNADVVLTVKDYQNGDDTLSIHPVYTIRSVNYVSGDGGPLNLRLKTLNRNSEIKEGELYSAEKLQQTYNNFSRLQAVRYTNIKFYEIPDIYSLECDVQVSTNKPSTISFQPEGTNTSGDLGVALSVGYENRNLFHGSELFSLQARSAFEAITGLEGYNDGYYQEYSLESKLQFPCLIIPVLSSKYGKLPNASSELSGRYDLQNRPEFHRRVFSTVWRYRWQNPSKNTSYRFDVLDLNYVYMPWISTTFKQDYLESENNRNAILRYNYEDLFIMKIGFGITKSSKEYSLRTNIETSGNLLSALAKPIGFKKTDGQYTLFNIAFAQYAKGDIDYTRLVEFDDNNHLALHGSFGIAYPYGNSTILPFEKRYFSGGANSVRGWNVRSLGPGCFKGTDGRIDFINQTGDIKFDCSVEYRTKIFWKLHGAMFVDAGNIWTIREYAEQEGGQFRFDKFYKQIAVSYGLGARLYLGYFILRFDFGMKAINPAYENTHEHYPIIYPKLGRDLAFHFAVGLPF